MNQPNGGLASARNAGHKLAKGKYIAWMDADDIAMPERVALQVAVLEAFPEVGLVSSDFSAFFCGAEDFDPSHAVNYYKALNAVGGPCGVYAHKFPLELNPDGDDRSVGVWFGNVFVNLLSGNVVHPPTVMLRKSVIDQIGECHCRLLSSSDYDYILRVARTNELAFIDRPLLRYRCGDHQMSNSINGGEMPREFRQILENWKKLEPELIAENSRRYSIAIAESFVWEAQHFARLDRRRSLALVGRSLSNAVLFKDVLRTLAMNFFPRSVLSIVGRYLLGARP